MNYQERPEELIRLREAQRPLLEVMLWTCHQHSELMNDAFYDGGLGSSSTSAAHSTATDGAHGPHDSQMVPPLLAGLPALAGSRHGLGGALESSITPGVRCTAMRIFGGGMHKVMEAIAQQCERDLEHHPATVQSRERRVVRCDHWHYEANSKTGSSACKVYGAGRAGRFS